MRCIPLNRLQPHSMMRQKSSTEIRLALGWTYDSDTEAHTVLMLGIASSGRESKAPMVFYEMRFQTLS